MCSTRVYPIHSGVNSCQVVEYTKCSLNGKARNGSQLIVITDATLPTCFDDAWPT